MTGVHQVLAGTAPRDAISNHALRARDLLRARGLRSEIFSGGVHPALAGDVHPAAAYAARSRPGDLAILHYSIDSPAFAHVADAGNPVVFHYHNITPDRFLWSHAPRVAIECRRGRERLAGYAKRVAASCADSLFNAKELAEAGFADPVAVGILRNALNRDPVTRGPVAGAPRLLFVGRGVPNKAQHDLVLAVAALHETGVPATLTLAGSWDIAPTYLRACRQLAEGLGVADAIAFAGSVDDDALAGMYRDADVFVCLSDHEGFCVPLLEAMEAGLPIVAYAAGAVPETVGGAGIVVTDKAPSTVAEAVLLAAGDDALRAAMAAARAPILEHFSDAAVGARLDAFLAGCGIDGTRA